MYYPQLQQKSGTQQLTGIFKGLNRAEEIADGEFAREMNLSTREYPMLCPRKPRGIGEEISGTYRGMMEKNGKLVTIEGSAVKYGGQTVEGISASEEAAMLPKKLVGMGAYVLIFPDKVYFNSVDLTDRGSIENSFESTGEITYTLCRLDGSDFGRVSYDFEEPENPEDGDYWLYRGSTPHQLMMYSAMNGVWTAIPTVYTRITAEGIDEGFETGDTVEISGIEIDEYEPDPEETREAGPEEHLIIYDADEAAMTALTVTYEPEQKGSGKPDKYNERNFVGLKSVEVHISQTNQPEQGTTIAADWSATAGTLYGWTYDALTGVVTKTHGRIQSYDDEINHNTIAGKKWLSSRDEYVEGRFPSDGAEVVYELSSPVTYSLTANEPETTRGKNHLWASAGQVEAQYHYYDPDYANAKAQAEALNGSQYIYDKGDGYITVAGVLDEAVTQSDGTITVDRKCPEMEYYVESNNRLWGCHYGPGEDGAPLNEIYACKLGDFKNWRVYQQISTDSYAVSVGSDGPFTGAAAYNGTPMFFKADCVHKIFGSQPNNFQVMTTQMPGVQQGSGDSVRIVDDTLYFLSGSGVMAYDGSYPVRVSMALGDEPMSAGIAGALERRYYLLATRADGKHMFVYDTMLNIWHEENAEDWFCFEPMQSDLYMMREKSIDTAMGSAGEKEDRVEWLAETGLQGWENLGKRVRIGAADTRYITRFYLRAKMEEDTILSCSLQYEGKGKWEKKLSVTAYEDNTQTRLMPVYPRRCDHMKTRIEGLGEIKIHSIIRTVTSGGDGKRG